MPFRLKRGRIQFDKLAVRNSNLVGNIRGEKAHGKPLARPGINRRAHLGMPIELERGGVQLGELAMGNPTEVNKVNAGFRVLAAMHTGLNSFPPTPRGSAAGIATALKEIYRAHSADAAEGALTAFEAGPWGQRYPAIGQSWRRAWSEVIPFFAFPDDVRRIIYTTNAIESLNSKLRRAVRARGHFPSDDAATKLLYVILNRSEKEWKMPPREWTMAKAQFAVIFGERFIKAMAA